MSQVMCMDRVVPLRNSRLPKGRYDAWCRSESDRLRMEVARAYAQGSALEGLVGGGDIHRPYELLKRLPDVRWGVEDDNLNLRLTLIRALFSKDEDMLSGVDRKEVAFRAFRAAEVGCGVVNRRFLRESDLSGHLVGDVGAVIHAAQRKISLILGEAPSIDELHPTFGPGAAATCSKYTTARHKLSTPPSISNSASAIAVQLAEGMSAWVRLHREVKVVPGRLEFVPKNYQTDRSIVVEPSLTGSYQRAVGTLMKQRMLKAGINLYDQSINRDRARAGSITGEDNCTIDLKAASDSLAYGVVLELLPFPWFELLDSLRSEVVRTPDGKVMRLQKFSSMGNGYTFELESLLFYSIAFGLSQVFSVPFDLTVFGDDLVCNERLARLIQAWFPFFGFSVNTEKSFMNGHFRESCGGDYWKGVDVRPFFWRGRCSFHTVVLFYNHLVRKPHQDPGCILRNLLLSWLPTEYKIFGPDGYGDGHLVDDRPLADYLKPYGREKGWSGYTFTTYIEVPDRHLDEVVGDVVLPAYHAYAVNRRSAYHCPADRLAFDALVPARLRSWFLRSLLREIEADLGDPVDHYVVRRSSKNKRVKGRRIRVYILGSAP